MRGFSPQQTALRSAASSGSGGQWGANSATAGVYAACVRLREAVAQKVGFDANEAVFADGTIVVRSPSGSDCDLLVARDEPIGLLLIRAPDGAWLGTACSVVGPGQLVAEGGEPRGGVIKVGIGLVILGLVILWALRRLRRGARPELPGSPGS